MVIHVDIKLTRNSIFSLSLSPPPHSFFFLSLYYKDNVELSITFYFLFFLFFFKKNKQKKCLSRKEDKSTIWYRIKMIKFDRSLPCTNHHSHRPWPLLIDKTNGVTLIVVNNSSFLIFFSIFFFFFFFFSPLPAIFQWWRRKI